MAHVDVALDGQGQRQPNGRGVKQGGYHFVHVVVRSVDMTVAGLQRQMNSLFYLILW